MIYNLTHPQKRIFQLEQMYPQTSSANVMGNVFFTLSVDLKVLEEAINLTIKHCDALRTILVEDEGAGVSFRINDYQWVDIEHFDFKDREDDFIKWKQIESQKPFKLFESNLCKFCMFISPKGENGLVIKFHHIISDAWAIVRVQNIIKHFYLKLSKGEEIDEPIYSHIKFGETEKVYLSSNRCKKDRQYWIDTFCDFDTTTTIKPRNASRSIAAKRFTKEVNGVQYDEIIEFCKKNRVTPYAFMFSCVQLLMWIYTDNPDVTIGTVLLNRSTKEEKNTPGILISTLAVRNKIDKDISFIEFVNKVSSSLFEVMKHQKYPYDKLLDELRNDFGITQELYDISISYQNALIDNNDELKVKTEWVFNNNSFDMLTIHINDRDNNHEFCIDYDYQIEQLDECEVEEFHTYLFNVVKWGIENSDKTISKVTCLTEEQHKRIIGEAWGAVTDVENQPIIGIFEKIEEKYKDKPAVYDGSVSYTYKQIDEKANRMANCLIQRDIVKGDNIPVVMNCSVDFVVSILAVMKCGATYVPVDCNYPKERIDYIINHCNAKLVLCNNINIDEELLKYEVINVSKFDFQKYSDKKPQVMLDGNDIIYIIYTSGTTGTPKGVALRHRNVVNYINWAIKAYVENGKGNMPFFTSISFDLTVTSIFVPLLSGSSILVYGEDNTNQVLEKIMNDGNSNIVKLTPAHLCMVNELECSNKQIYAMILGGEELKGKVAYETHTKFNGKVKIYNEYGPTEATVGCMIYQYKPEDDINSGVLIGKAIDNSAVYVMSKRQDLRPAGMIGELCVAGAGLAAGYYKDKYNTEDKFLTSSLLNGERIYRTGDLAVLDRNGNVQYRGRVDEQVKIRGFRIELTEIENVAIQYDGINEVAVVLVNNEGLGIYYVTEKEVSKSGLRQHLKEKLPAYMIPTYYVEMDKMPLTTNGKTNIKALPAVSEKDMIKSNFVSAKNELEHQMTKIWREVLKVENIGAEDDFYDLGGHSLKAIELSNTIKVNMKMSVGVSDIFSYSTIRSLCDYLDNMGNRHLHTLKINYDAELRNELSSNELRLYSIWQMDKKSITYNMPGLFCVHGNLDIDRLRKSLILLIEHNQTLRTRYILKNDEPTISIMDSEKVEETFLLESFVADGKSLDDIVKDLVRPFDLENDLLIKAAIGYVDNKPELFFVDIHHIASDGISNGIYMEQIANFYHGEVPEKMKYTYRDYAAWTHQLAKNEDLYRNGQAFWQKVYDKEIEPLNIPADYQKVVNRNQCNSCEIILDNDVLRDVKKIVKENKITLFTFMLGCFSILLGKYSGNEDMVIGVPYLGRSIQEFEDTTGFFATTLPVRIKPQRHIHAESFFVETKKMLNQCYENSFIPFEKIVQLSRAERSGNGNVMFNVVFGMLDDSNAVIELGQDISLRQIEKDFSVEKFDITLQVFERTDGLRCRISFASDIYSYNSMSGLLHKYRNLIKNMCSNYKSLLKDIDVYSSNERDQLRLKSGNITTQIEDCNSNIGRVFEKTAKKYSDKKAVCFGESYLTYDQLNKKVNKLANYLRKAGVGRNNIVAIMLDKSIEMIVSILAVIKAGAAYLPIDIENTHKRVLFIVEDSNAKKVLSSSKYKDYFESSLYVDVYDEGNYDNESDENLQNINNEEDIAYVIYTSGTSGTPKGTLMMHKNAIAIAFENDVVAMSNNDRVMQLCNYAFDVSVGEIMCSLLNGATLYIADKNMIFNINVLTDYIVKNRITFIFTTTAIFNLLVDTNVEALKGIRRISVGGEKASVKHMNRAFEVIGSEKVINAYGPTETTVLSTGYIVNKPIDEQKYGRVPIGKCLSYLYTYIMNEDMEILPDGAVGELVIGGRGVGKGYLNNPDLTAKKFIKNPFNEDEIMYRTGDLVRMLANGDIDFLDRIDGQVKIRGFRVETSEIEKKIKEYESISEAVVVVDTDENCNVTQLVAYVVSEIQIDVNEIRKYLFTILPSYMVPSFIYQVEYIPLTSNGKVDKKKLIKPVNEHKELNYKVENEVQEILVEVWKQVLGIGRVSIDENFIELGGDSIKAIQLVSKLQKRGLVLDVKTVMSVQTIREQSVFVKSMEKSNENEAVSGKVLSTPIICEFLEGYGKIFDHFNQAIVITNEERFDESIINKALDKVCCHHDVLRSVWKDNALYICDEDKKAFSFEMVQVNGLTSDNKAFIEDMCAVYQKSLDIENGPLIKVVLFRCNDVDNLLFVIHHLLIDGVSWRILMEDFETSYTRAIKGEEVELQSKTTSYQKWAEELKKFANSDKIKKAYEYWNDICENSYSEDVERVDQKNRLLMNLTYENVTISDERTNILLHKTRKAFHCDTADLLLAALCKAYAETFGEGRLFVNVENHGREAFDPNVSVIRTIGWFTAVYPQLIEFNDCKNNDDYIISVKDAVRKVPNKGFEYGVLKYISSNEKYDTTDWKPYCKVGFNYLGEYDNVSYGKIKMADIEIKEAFSLKMHQNVPIELNALVKNHRLELKFSYSLDEFSLESMKLFIERYKVVLNEMIDYCSNKGHTTYTVTDFADESLTLNELSEIMDMFNT